VPQHEPVALDGDDAARGVQDVADAELSYVADVAVGRQADVAAPPGVVATELERIEQGERGVAEVREIERDRQVVVVVDLPAVDDPAVRLEPGVHDGLLVEARLSRRGPSPATPWSAHLRKRADPRKPTRLDPPDEC